MIEQAFNSFYKESVGKNLLIQEAAGEGIIHHLTHLEELVLKGQKQGLDLAVQFINEITRVLEGSTDSKIFTTVKYDGAPAIICGYNPEDNRFFVGTKGVGAKNAKACYTVQDIVTYYGEKPGLAEKLKLALLYLPKVIKQNMYQGDFMFDKSTLNKINHEGEELITFKPNTITYAVEADSELGRRVQNAQIGIVFHTRLTGSSFAQLKQSPDVSVAEFNLTPEVWVDDAKFKDLSGLVTLTNEEKKLVDSNLQSIQNSAKVIGWTTLPTTFYADANTFINFLIKRGEFVGDLDKNFNDFIEWFNQRRDAEINNPEKVKTDATRQKKLENKNRAIEFLKQNKLSIINIFNITEKIAEIKKIFITKYSNAVRSKQFIAQPDGTLKVTKPEGFVAVDHVGNSIKLVDRLEFSRANFSIPREEKFK
jgi:hypothetical protein